MEQGPETLCIIYTGQRGRWPRGGGVLQLRVARKLRNYVSSPQELMAITTATSASATRLLQHHLDCFELLRCLEFRTV